MSTAAIVTRRDAAEALADMEGPLRQVAAILELLQEALTPAKVTLPQSGLAHLVRGMHRDAESALKLWETAFRGTHDLRQPSPPDAAATDPGLDLNA